MRKQILHITFPVCAAIVAAGTWWVNAGPLNPPAGAVASTGRFGPRTEIDAIPYTITQPGSYYMGASLTMAGTGNGVTIATDDVDIDLNGFDLEGGGSGGTGIRTSAAYDRVTIHDGRVHDWTGSGISLQFGGDHFHVYNVTATGNGGDGITIVGSGILRHVIASQNGDNGISTDGRNKLTNCITYANGANGMQVGESSHVSDSVSASNGLAGYELSDSCVLIGSTARENNEHGVILHSCCNVTDCTSSRNGAGGVLGSGFALDGPGSQLFDCVAADNWDDGFEMLYFGTHEPNSVQACTAASNGVSGAGDGFSWIRKVIGCFAIGNQGNGITMMGGVCNASAAYENASTGIFVWDCTVADCEANYNNDGIWAEDSVVKNNTVVYNQNDGIVLGMGSLVWRNNCSENFDDGIEAQGDGNTIEGNNCCNNMMDAIDTSLAPGNTILSNRERSNPGGYNLNWAADTWGPIFAGPGAVTMAAGDQFVNISY